MREFNSCVSTVPICACFSYTNMHMHGIYICTCFIYTYAHACHIHMHMFHIHICTCMSYKHAPMHTHRHVRMPEINQSQHKQSIAQFVKLAHANKADDCVYKHTGGAERHLTRGCKSGNWCRVGVFQSVTVGVVRVCERRVEKRKQRERAKSGVRGGGCGACGCMSRENKRERREESKACYVVVGVVRVGGVE